MPGVKSIPSMEKSKVRRCLFGPPDHDSLRKDLDECLKKARTETTEKWNFNFEKEMPLDGRYRWELIDNKNGYIPEFYTKPYVSRPRKVAMRRSLESKENNTSTDCTQDAASDLGCKLIADLKDSESSQECNIVNSSVSQTNTSEEQPRHLVQSQIDDYYKKRKGSPLLQGQSSTSLKKRRL